jgi:hypothetical protein
MALALGLSCTGKNTDCGRLRTGTEHLDLRKREKVTGWRKLNTEDIYNVLQSQNFRIMKSSE